MLTHKRGVGDTLTAFGVTLKKNGEAVDLTGKYVLFYIEDADGEEVLAATATGVTVSDATAGEVEFDFPLAVVATARTLYGYFYVYNADPDVDENAERDTYPPDSIKLVIGDQTTDRDVTNDIDIRTAANNPKRMRTDEGSIEERSIDDLIKADRYLATKEGQSAVPWGLRIAKSKPPGTV